VPQKQSDCEADIEVCMHSELCLVADQAFTIVESER
jgi:hypothetical protein